MKHSDTIAALGGPKSVADALRAKGVTVADVTVRSWTLEGRSIPAKYWLPISEVAETRGCSVSFADLAEAVAARPKEEAA